MYSAYSACYECCDTHANICATQLPFRSVCVSVCVKQNFNHIYIAPDLARQSVESPLRKVIFTSTTIPFLLIIDNSHYISCIPL